MRRRYIASSIRANRRSDERSNVFHLANTELKVGDVFIFDGLEWFIEEVGELEEH